MILSGSCFSLLIIINLLFQACCFFCSQVEVNWITRYLFHKQEQFLALFEWRCFRAMFSLRWKPKLTFLSLKDLDIDNKKH